MKVIAPSLKIIFIGLFLWFFEAQLQSSCDWAKIIQMKSLKLLAKQSPEGEAAQKLKAIYQKLTEQGIGLTASVQESPHFLMSTMEFGQLDFLKATNGKAVKASFGGLATVIQDIIEYWPELLAKRGGGDISLVSMRYDGIDLNTLELFKEVEVIISGVTEKAQIYKAVHPNGVAIYFVDHPSFRGRTILKTTPEANIYFNENHPRLIDQIGIEYAKSYSVFNQAIAKLHDMIKPNIYMSHDYYGSVAPIYFQHESVQAIVLHNASVQGGYFLKGNHPILLRPANWTNLTHDMDIFRGVWNIDAFTFENYFIHRGLGNMVEFNMLKGGMLWIRKRNLIDGFPVSEGFAEELESGKVQALHPIIEKGIVSAGDLTFGVVDGIENGLGEKFKAKVHPFLKKIEKEEDIVGIKSPEVIQAFLTENLQFGQDLSTQEGIAAVNAQKDKLKRLLQIETFAKSSPEKPIFSLVARLVGQKNALVLAKNAEFIVENGGQVVIGGLPGDSEGIAAAKMLENLAKKYPHDIFFKSDFIAGHLKVLIQAGADFFVIPSRFEPCGLTDIEASWLGTIAVARRVGGLGKVKNAFYYEFDVKNKGISEEQSLQNLIKEIIVIYKNNPEKIKQMRIGAMGEDFTWQVAFDKYLKDLSSMAFYRVIENFENQLKDSPGSEHKVIMSEFFLLWVKTPVPQRENIVRLLAKKKVTDRSFIENYILNYLDPAKKPSSSIRP